MNAKLVVVGGDTKTTEVNLRLPTTIGRGREVELTLPHPLVSRKHCQIFERDGRLFVRDLGSLNGTFLNNQRLDGEGALDPDQLLTLGNVTFRAVYQPMIPSAQTKTDDDSLAVEQALLPPVNVRPAEVQMDEAGADAEIEKPIVFEPIESEAAELAESAEPALAEPVLSQSLMDLVEADTDADTVDEIEPQKAVAEIQSSPSPNASLPSGPKPMSFSAQPNSQVAFGGTAASASPESIGAPVVPEEPELDDFLNKLPR